MRGNSGIIGKPLTTSKTLASGVFDTFDTFNSRKNDGWPSTVYYNSTSFNSGTINENTNQSITLNTVGVPVNTTLFWTVLHGNSIASDFNGNVVSGSFTQSATSNTGTFSVATAFTGNTSKTPKTFQIQIRTGSTGGPVVYTTGTYTIPTITVSNLYWSPTSINEGSSSFLYLQCGNCGSNTNPQITVNYSPPAGFILGVDTSSFPLTSNINVSALSNFPNPLTVVNDYTTEGTETVSVQLTYNGINLGTLQTVTINDTSLTPSSGTITPSTTTLTENNTITFTCTINQSFTGTAYYSINNVTGTMSTVDFTDALLSGSFNMTNGSGSFTKRLVADGLSEGEAFSVSLRFGSTTGTVFATTATISTVDMAAPVQEEFTTPGTYSWLCPSGVTSVCVVCIGGGGGGIRYQSSWVGGSMAGGGGGGLGWRNNIAVTPGTSYTVVVGAGGVAGTYGVSGGAGGQSYFINASTVAGNGGGGGVYYTNISGGTYAGQGGGNGGNVPLTDNVVTPGGGGAGGYAGNGGRGGGNNANYYPASGVGGGGAGGGNSTSGFHGYGGGGTGIYGQGANGVANNNGGGGGGSGGGAGSAVDAVRTGGLYGGGGGGQCFNTVSGGDGGGGAVRIIWGAGRAFPSTNTQNM
jgi:hypothetical protein